MKQAAAPLASPLNVAILLYPGVGLGDFGGAADVFDKAHRVTKGLYHVYTVAFAAGPVATGDQGPVIEPQYQTSQMPPPDILVIPGSTMPRTHELMHDQQLLAFLRAYQPRVQVLLSVCTGAFLLGAAGLLDGRRCTTHFLSAAELQRLFPQTRVVHDVRYVDEGNLVTSSGIVCGTDAALQVVARYSGAAVTTQVEQILQHVKVEHTKWPPTPTSPA